MGCLVVADDHMGHGRTTGSNDVVGYFTNGWFAAVDDTYHLLQRTKKEFPGVPYVLFGHSMGSFMAQTILQKYPDCAVDACVLCGSGWQSDVAIAAGIRICNAACKRLGETIPNARILKLVFGAYNLLVEHPRTPYDWVCRDQRVVDALIRDPLCSHAVTVGLMRDMLTGIEFIQSQENLNRMRKDLPVLLVSGGDDPVGTYGEGVRRTAEKFVESGMSDVMLKLFPLCRHEILNEINKQEVYQFVAKWMIDRCKI
jgi:alpha-beta hydrolase superfamily lysophospholipase